MALFLMHNPLILLILFYLNQCFLLGSEKNDYLIGMIYGPKWELLKNVINILNQFSAIFN